MRAQLAASPTDRPATPTPRRRCRRRGSRPVAARQLPPPIHACSKRGRAPSADTWKTRTLSAEPRNSPTAPLASSAVPAPRGRSTSSRSSPAVIQTALRGKAGSSARVDGEVAAVAADASRRAVEPHVLEPPRRAEPQPRRDGALEPEGRRRRAARRRSKAGCSVWWMSTPATARANGPRRTTARASSPARRSPPQVSGTDSSTRAAEQVDGGDPQAVGDAVAFGVATAPAATSGRRRCGAASRAWAARAWRPAAPRPG